MTIYADWPFRLIPNGSRFAGWTPGPFTFIRPSRKNDSPLHVHEAKHREQFARNPVRYYLYLVEPSVRLDLEAEAFAAQIVYEGSGDDGLRRCADSLYRHYRTGANYEDCLAAIKGYL